MSSIYRKDPDATLDYQVDWSAWLGTDTISVSSWIAASGITTGSPASSHTTTTATVWASGGTAGEVYTLTNRIVTAGGRTNDQSIVIQVSEQ